MLLSPPTPGPGPTVEGTPAAVAAAAVRRCSAAEPAATERVEGNTPHSSRQTMVEPWNSLLLYGHDREGESVLQVCVGGNWLESAAAVDAVDVDVVGFASYFVHRHQLLLYQCQIVCHPWVYPIRVLLLRNPVRVKSETTRRPFTLRKVGRQNSLSSQQ